MAEVASSSPEEDRTPRSGIGSPVEIVRYDDAHAGAFNSLNRAWLDAHGLYEPPDEKQLADPRGQILDRGGDIFVALAGGQVVGTAALIPVAEGVIEIVKVTVAERARGGGLGRRLVERCIARARELGMRRMVLVSSTRLGPALRLYESMGFVHRPPPAPLVYATADVYMELELEAASPAPRSVRHFYDDLAPVYHLIFEDWDASIARQGHALDGIIRGLVGPHVRFVHDAAMGIGTQAIALAMRGYRVTGSDLSAQAAARAGREAAVRGVDLPCHAADLRALSLRPASCDVIMACDNAVPHLLHEHELRQAFAECRRCLRPGGALLISLRDYGDPPPRGTVERRPYGERSLGGNRVSLEQIWTWDGDQYDLALAIEMLDGAAAGRRQEFRSRYRAYPVPQVQAIMEAGGFDRVQRIDGRFYQPVLLGSVA